MLDNATFLLTQTSASGPILRPEDPPLFDMDEEVDDRPVTRGRVIGGVISLALLAATGAYLALAI